MRPTSHIIDKNTLRYYHRLKILTKFIKKYMYLIVLAAATCVLFYTQTADWTGYYDDADGYMRALRVKHLLISPSFMEQPISESNYPFGEFLHWTRPMDFIWLLFTIPFCYLNELNDIIFLGGAFVAPILGVITVLLLAYGLRRKFNVYLAILGSFIFLSNPVITEFFAMGRPDHHALMIMLSIYAEALCLCWLKKRHNRYLTTLGMVLALATFTVAEGILLYALFVSFFLYFYIYKNISLFPVVKISKSFAITLSICWLINPPHESFLYPDNGRISVLYVTAAWLAYIGFYALYGSHLHTVHIKLLSLWAIILSFLMLLTVIFGYDIFYFPVNEEIRALFHQYISEYKSIADLGVSTNLYYHGFAGIALILNLHMLKFYSYRRLMVLNLILGVPLYLISLAYARFSCYNALYCILPFLCWLDYLYKKSDFAQNKSPDFPGYLWGAIMCIIFLGISVALLEQYTTKPQKALYSSGLCSVVRKTGGTLVTDIFLGPQYIWHCGVNVVATPYHHNEQGITDNQAILNTENDNEIMPLLVKHQVTQILLFEDYSKTMYRMSDADKNKLYYRLIKHENIPLFLREVKTSHQNAHLYKVKM